MRDSETHTAATAASDPMTRERATAGVSANTLANEAWAAGCRDVQAAIN
jgi:hypothetical protein